MTVIPIGDEDKLEVDDILEISSIFKNTLPKHFRVTSNFLSGQMTKVRFVRDILGSDQLGHWLCDDNN